MGGLDPDVAAVLESMRASGAPPLWTLSVAEARQQLAAATAELAPQAPHIPSEDLTIAGDGADVPIRIYRSDRNGKGPMVLLIHGGGWALGSIETHDAIARTIAAGADATVVSVDYRLAPEHPFPAGFNDCVTTLAWCDVQRLPGQSLVVMGDSAGANLTAALTLHARDNHGPRIDAQMLIYPLVDLTVSPPYVSRTQYGGGEYFLGQQDIDWLRSLYLTDATDTRNPFVSPMLADNLRGLPPALIVTAGYDPLCGEGLAYHRRLSGAGVPSSNLHFGGAIHGFLSFAGAFASGRDALARTVDWLRVIPARSTD